MGSDTNLERAEVLSRTLLLAQCVSPGNPIVSAATVARKVRMLGTDITLGFTISLV